MFRFTITELKYRTLCVRKTWRSLLPQMSHLSQSAEGKMIFWHLDPVWSPGCPISKYTYWFYYLLCAFPTYLKRLLLVLHSIQSGFQSPRSLDEDKVDRGSGIEIAPSACASISLLRSRFFACHATLPPKKVSFGGALRDILRRLARP